MLKRVKIIIASTLVLIGGVIFCIAMNSLNWDFKNLSTSKFETNIYQVTDNFNSILIDVDTDDITFVLASDGKCKIECFEQEKIKHSVLVSDNVLKIESNDERKFFDYFGINFNSPKLTVYLAKNSYDALNIKASTGDIVIPSDFEFKTIDISNSTGDVTVNATVSDIKIKLSTGDIKVENATANSIDIITSTGDVKVSNVTANSVKIKVSTGDVTLSSVIASNNFNIKTSTGDVKFNDSDAYEIHVETDTGDVTGTLLSSKIFSAHTDTGRKNVPQTTIGGICEIKTDTGDIIISIK